MHLFHTTKLQTKAEENIMPRYKKACSRCWTVLNRHAHTDFSLPWMEEEEELGV